MSKPLRVLVVEDSENDAALLSQKLREGGYEPVFERVETAVEMSAALDRQSWDLVVADHSLPKFSGLGSLKLLKQRGLDLPLIIVSGTIGEVMAVEAMKAGAHDYVMKNNLARLLPAIERELNDAEMRRRHRRAEAALRESQEQFRATFEQAAVGIAHVATDGRWLRVNQKLCSILGFTYQELLERTLQDLTHPDDLETDLEQVGQMLAGEIQTYSLPKRFLRKDRSLVWINLSVSIVRTSSGEPKYFISVIEDITEGKNAEEHIKASLREKELLLKEVHHRVKNNLQIISSMLNLQSGYIKDPKALELLCECQNRIKSMALIHEKLYQADDFSRIDLAEYMHSLLSMVFLSYSAQTRGIQWETHIEAVYLGIDVAIPLGLMTHELISNCLKHAFPSGRAGVVRISLCAHQPHQLTLSVRDNGAGMPAGFDYQNAPTLGLRIVRILTEQIRGKLEVYSEGGAEFRVTFSAR